MEITYTNAKGLSLTLRSRPPYFLSKMDGAGSVKNNILTFQAPDQDGAFFVSDAVNMRNIILEGTVMGINKDDAFDKARELMRTFTPKEKGSLIYRGKHTECYVESADIVAASISRMPGFIISLLCPSPFWDSPEDEIIDVAVWTPAFTFPLQIPSSGIAMGTRSGSNNTIIIKNDGDVPCGCEFIFTATGNVLNPLLTNTATGEYLKVNTSLFMGDELHIYTQFANKRIYQNGQNVFSLLDSGSTFLQLEVGDNTLKYGADNGADVLEVRIKYRPLYLGV